MSYHLSMPSVRLSEHFDGRLFRVTLSRPERLNAFDLGMIDELEQALGVAEVRRPRAIAIDSEGKAFSAGGDLSIGPEALPMLASRFHDCIAILAASPAAVVTIVRGVAAGGGFALAIAGDLRIGTPEARFRIAYGRAGLSVDGGISWRLPRLVGLADTQRLMFEDPDVDAQEAVRLGLLHRVVEPGGVDAALEAVVKRLELQARGSIARDKALLARSLEGTLQAALEDEQRRMAEGASSADGREGITAFREKRPPRFS